MKPSERSLQFKRHYTEHFGTGKSVKEIANLYGLSRRHAYNLIRDIAEEMGVAYESLIYQPHAEHAMAGRKEFLRAMPIELKSFREESRATISAMGKTIHAMGRMMKQWPEDPSLADEEETR